MAGNIEDCKRWLMLNPVFARIAKEYKRRYGFIWTDERPKAGPKNSIINKEVSNG